VKVIFDRVSIANALHCTFARHRHPDQETLKTIAWILRRYKMHNISQAPIVIPIGVWRALHATFPGDFIDSEFASVRRLAAQFDAENAAAHANEGIMKMLGSAGRFDQ
jgi:hypothetical protein